MNYKETLFFIGKCLTINHEEHNRVLIEQNLKKNTVDWDAVVKVSTGHFVFPALYLNLKRANFLQYLPADLVEYMQHITDLNRERNQQIISQAKEINELLLANNITPIFLKGTGNLLEGLYDDIAERMVGDIDFLVVEKNCKKAYAILEEKGYNKVTDIYEEHRHLNRLIHSNKVAAVEIHRAMLKEKNSNSFNYLTIKDAVFCKKKISYLSIEDQIKLTVFSILINDDAHQLKTIQLKHAYDVFKLFYKKDIFQIEANGLQQVLNDGLITYATILNVPNKIIFNNRNEKSKTYLKQTLNSINKSKKNQQNYLFIKDRSLLLFKAFFKKTYFKFILNKLLDRNWYKRRFGI